LKLDPRQRTKLSAIEAEKEEAWAAHRALSERERNLREERARKQADLDLDLSGMLMGAQPKAPAADDPRPQEIAWLTEELGRLAPLPLRAQARSRVAARPYDNASRPLGLVAPATLAPIVVEPVRADDLAAEVDGIRATLTELAREEEAVRHAPLPLDEALAELDREIADIGRAWAPDGAVFFRRDRERSGRYRLRLVPDP